MINANQPEPGVMAGIMQDSTTKTLGVAADVKGPEPWSRFSKAFISYRKLGAKASLPQLLLRSPNGPKASDALLENEASHALHLALGFQETERVIFFRKSLS